MAETKRRTPAIPERKLGEYHPAPQFIRTIIPGVQPEPANPVIGVRYGQYVLESPRAFVAPQYLPYPYFQEAPAAPANPVVGYRYGRDILESLRAFVTPAFLPFPYFQEAAPGPANPVIGFRQGQLANEDPRVGAHLVPPQRFTFPYFQEPPPPGAATGDYILLRRRRRV